MKLLQINSVKSIAILAGLAIAFFLGSYIGQNDTSMQQGSSSETALEHSIKHQDEKFQCPMHPDIIKDEPGNCPICGMNLEPVKQEPTKSESKEKKILYWVAPMDPNYQRDKPGKSPMGMDLIPVYDDGGDASSSTVKISPAVENNLGVRTALTKKGELWRKIDTVGYVDLDESKVSHIHLRVDGWIEKLSINVEGERVTKGQRLFDLYSPKLVNAMEEYVQALRVKNNRLMQASEEKLISLGISKRQIKKLNKSRKVSQTISIYAPQNGIVTMMKVREGMYVKPSTKVMTLADLSSIWMIAEVFESQSDWVKKGQIADVKLSFIPGRTWEGVVDYVYPSLDPKTRTLRVRLRFDNPGELLKPNMYTSVSIYGGALENVLSVPRESVIRSGGTERLIIAKGEGNYEQRLVTVGIESGDWVEIKEGLKADEKIVTSAHFLIDSEASMKASLLRMSSANEVEEDADNSSQMSMATGTGLIKSLMKDHGMITLQHDPIEALGWPEMTMDFITEEGVSLDGVDEGDAVVFSIMKKNDKYLISEISKQENKK